MKKQNTILKTTIKIKNKIKQYQQHTKINISTITNNNISDRDLITNNKT